MTRSISIVLHIKPFFPFIFINSPHTFVAFYHSLIRWCELKHLIMFLKCAFFQSLHSLLSHALAFLCISTCCAKANIDIVAVFFRLFLAKSPHAWQASPCLILYRNMAVFSLLNITLLSHSSHNLAHIQKICRRFIGDGQLLADVALSFYSSHKITKLEKNLRNFYTFYLFFLLK